LATARETVLFGRALAGADGFGDRGFAYVLVATVLVAGQHDGCPHP
jgi:hypothetical protein